MCRLHVPQVHYDCLYRGLDVVSSRSARLLGGNRTIAEVSGTVAAIHVCAWDFSAYTTDRAQCYPTIIYIYATPCLIHTLALRHPVLAAHDAPSQ